MTKTRRIFVLTALGLALATGPAAAQSAIALWLEASGGIAPAVHPMTEVTGQALLKLDAGAKVRFFHFGACKVVAVEGGSLELGPLGYRVTDGGKIFAEQPRRCPVRVRLASAGSGGQTTTGLLLMRGADGAPAAVEVERRSVQEQITKVETEIRSTETEKEKKVEEAFFTRDQVRASYDSRLAEQRSRQKALVDRLNEISIDRRVREVADSHEFPPQPSFVLVGQQAARAVAIEIAEASESGPGPIRATLAIAAKRAAWPAGTPALAAGKPYALRLKAADGSDLAALPFTVGAAQPGQEFDVLRLD